MRISTLNGKIQAANLPFFRHATQRQLRAQKLAKMALVRQTQQPGLSSPEMLDRIIELKARGFSYGRIAETLFDEQGISLDPSVVRRRLEALEETCE
ncbi:MAG: hypothetical protein ACXADB_02255 [Candidatus Hermodarchaeia archaeon]